MGPETWWNDKMIRWGMRKTGKKYFFKIIIFINIKKLNSFNCKSKLESLKLSLWMCVCFALKSSRELLLLFTYLISLCKDITFPLITKFKSKKVSKCGLRLIHDINKPVRNLYFRFEFFVCKLDNSLCTSLIIRLKRILMIETQKNVIRY